MTFWEKVKDNWSQLAFVGAILLLLVGTFVQVRVSAIALAEVKGDAATLHINTLIDTKLAAQDLGTDSKIVAMDSERQINSLGVTGNKEAIAIERERLNEVGRILMKPPDNN